MDRNLLEMYWKNLFILILQNEDIIVVKFAVRQ